MRRFRLLDLGGVGGLRSQTLYHALCQGVSRGEPPTLALLFPTEPYVSVGFHRPLDAEVDLAYCREHGIPVYRRQAGGGAVYLDRNQLFFQLVVPEGDAPASIRKMYADWLRGPVETYQALGLPAYLSPGHDICVGPRKISGVGMAKIDRAIVLVGNILFDFDYGTMARLLKPRDPLFHGTVEQWMRRYVTTVRRELGRDIPRREVASILAWRFAAALGADLRPGTLSPYEEEQVEAWNRTFASAEWLFAAEARPSPTRHVKIRSGVYVSRVQAGDGAAAGKESAAGDGPAAGAVVVSVQARIAEVRLSEGWGLDPEVRAALERRLVGAELTASALEAAIAGDEASGRGGPLLARLAGCLARAAPPPE